jgi:uncharacterized protein (TIGR00251 family)
VAIELVSNSEGVILPVRAQPGARREGIVGEQAGGLKIAVTAPPDRGQANEAIIAILAQSLDLPKRSLTLLSGQSSRQKRILIRERTLEQVQAWLAQFETG